MPEQVTQAVPVSTSRSNDIEPRTFFVALLLLISCLYVLLARDSYMEDFHSYYTASMVLHDHLDPYFNHVNVDEKYADAKLDQVASQFIYPPSALFFFAPVSHVSYKLARLSFAIGLALVMVAILVFFERRFRGMALPAIALFISVPMIANVDKGQVDIPILALILAAFYCGNGKLAGTCLGAAISIKLAPVLALGWFIGERRWRTVAWSLVVAGGTTLAAIWRWGIGWQREFLQHMLRHEDPTTATLHHQFQTVQLINSQFLLVNGKGYTLERFAYGYLQNPLLPLGRYQLPVALVLLAGYLGWLLFSRQGRLLSKEAGFFGFLVVALLANKLLWAMGLVACFPLLLLIVDRSKTPLRTALLLLAPMLIPFPFHAVANRLLVWLVVAAFCVWQNCRDETEMQSDRTVLKEAQSSAQMV